MTNKSSTPEYLRKMLKNILQYNKMIQLKEKRIFINSLKYIPHSLYKMLENIPMPWESQKNTNILYHQSGAILFINEIPRSICKLYYAKWGSVWKSMKKEKKNRIHFSRMRFPPFDDEEVFIDYVDNIYHLPPLQSIKIEKNHYQAIPWLFENEINFKNFIETIKNKNKNIIKIPILQNLKKLSMPILNEVFDKNYFFLFDLSSFIIAKSLNIILPGGPRFEPDRQYFTDTHFENFDSDFNSSSVLTIPIRSEYKVVYSYLYNDKCMYINDFPYMYYSNSFIKFNSSNYVSFYFDPLIYPINYTKHNIRKKSMEMLLSNRLIPIFFNYKLFNKYTKISLELLWSTFPYNTKILDIKRIITISMINNWIREHCPITSPQKVRISFQKLLKNYILNQLHNKKKKLFQKKSLLKILQNSSYFSSTYMDWVEASLITCRQGHNMLNLLIHKKGLNFLHLDYNFNLKPVKTLTTKERKKSRFGNAFHLCREILRLNKLVLDAHIQFRLGNIDSFQLADGVQYLFSHVGHLTGIYRYKYKVMKQIRLCKDLKHLIYFKFNANVLHKGPGVGFWLPMWRVWIFFLRGMVPTLEKWLGNLLIRQFEGRASNKPNKSITKQRIESHFDIELRASVLGEVLDRISPNYRASKAKLILQHLSEAWRCWKANIPWIVQKIPKSIEEIIIKYVKQKADWWTNIAHYNRERIKRGATIDKNICRKNLGRLTRLFLKDYQQKQHFYLTNGPFLSSKDVVVIYRVLTAWVEMTNLKMIKFPTGNYKYGSKLLIITLEHLKDQFSLNTKLNMEQKEEMELIEFSFDNSTEILNLIKRQILIQRNFKEIYIQFMDYFDTLVPVFEINPLEKIADSFLDHFLWLEEYKLKILPNWVKPSDNTLSPLLVYNWCNAINNIYKIWEIKNGETIILMKLVLHEIHSNIDLSFLNRILRLFIDSSIVDYLSSKNNSIISFKDMSYMNILGIIRGIQFSTFIIQLYSITIDLLIIGLSRSLRLNKNSWLQNQDISSKVNEENQHPVKLYLRIINELFILLKIKRREKIEILEKYINSSNNQYHKITDYYSINNKSPTNVGTPLIKLNSNLGNALFEEMKNKVPSSFIQLKIDYLDISIYDTQIPYISCLIEGFQLKIINSFRLNEIKKSDYIAIWKLKSDNIDFGQTYCMIDIANKSIVSFQNRIRHIILTSGSSTFTKISNKWNTTLIGLVTYFRESIKSSDKLLQVIIKSENKIQNRVKMGLNSKMPSRFPPVVFYSPKEFGGLGMISMSHILIPKSELKYSTFLKHDITHFITGMSNSSHQTIPNIYRYISDWEFEFLESLMVWNEYGIKKLEAREKKKKLTIEDIENFWNKGIPRINTLFHKSRYVLNYEKGWRVRSVFKKFYNMKFNPFWWTDQKHDGKLWNLVNYRTDVIQSLGGIHGMLEHTLFKGTYFPTWEGLFWEKSSGFEETMRFRKLTNAQRSGLNQIPNRRFTLWWSPTINRANVYVGFQVQLDLTGIFMHGKIPTLKISLIQIFRSHLWQKIHESMVMDLCQILDNQSDPLGIEFVQKEIIHPRKSYKMNSSCADILIFSRFKWYSSTSTLLTDINADFREKLCSRFWLDIQLRWGDYDSHDIERYVRSKYLDYITDLFSIYPSSTGIMIGFDLCYNMYSCYGNWIPGLKMVMLNTLYKISRTNPALYVLRERIRKSLQLYSLENSETYLSTKNYGELFSNDIIWFVDDTNSYRVTIHKTAEGNFATKPINGCILIINPKTGQLLIKILHLSIWEGHRRLGQYSKWKSAEEVVNVLNSITKSEHPKKIIVTRKTLIDPLEVHLMDYSNIVIVGTDLDLPFQSILKLQNINSLVLKSPMSKIVLFNLYDNWLNSISSYTAFSRLLLILRGLHINNKKVVLLLKLDSINKSTSASTWPSLEDGDWIKIEIILKDVILGDFCKRNNIKIESLTQAEIRDIILGLDIPLIKNNKEKTSNNKIGNELVNNQNLSKTFNKDKNLITVITKTDYERIKYRSKLDWKNLLFSSLKIGKILKNITMKSDFQLPSFFFSYILPKNLIRKIITISSWFIEVYGFLYGKRAGNFKNVFSVIPPQHGLDSSESLLYIQIKHASISSLMALGWIVISPCKITKVINKLLLFHKELLIKLHNWNGDKCIIIIIEKKSDSCNLISLKITLEGFDYLSNITFEKSDHFMLKNDHLNAVNVFIGTKYSGFYLIPKSGPWNMYFLRNVIGRSSHYQYKIFSPDEFINENFRIHHFDEFFKIS